MTEATVTAGRSARRATAPDRQARPAARSAAPTSARPALRAASPSAPAVRRAKRAADQAISSDSVLVALPDGLGTVRVPSPKRLAFYGGIAALAAFGILDWPVALVIGIGHLLADDHRHKMLAEFGEALAEA
jgi:hypothetical protein